VAIVTNSIGSFAFIELTGQPGSVVSSIGMATRAGVDGVTLSDEGERGRPFILRSKTDVEDLESAWLEYAGYRELVGGDPQDLIYQDLDLASLDGIAGFAVTDIGMPFIRAIGGGSGGLRPPSLAYLECDWTLVAIPNEE
jgi:hypothetical protein